MREDQNDLGYDLAYFRSRSRLNNPRRQKAPPAVTPAAPSAVAGLPPQKKRRSGRGNAYQHTRTGARADLGGIVCRSSWESDVLRVLQLWKIDFLFEPTVFEFPENAQGRKSAYLPDIYLTKTDEYIEVKGMLDGRGRQKLRKFKKHYPVEFSKLTVIISKNNKANKYFFTKLGVNTILYYENLVKLFADKIVLWEGKH